MSVLKFVGAPGSLTLLVIACLIGITLAFAWPRNRRLGRIWVLAVFALYGILGLPWVATAIADRLTRHLPPEPASPGPFDTLVVFDGDNRRGRVAETLQVFDRDRPETIWVLGEDWIVHELASGGIPDVRIRHEASTANTREQMAWVAGLVASRPDLRPAIVMSRLQYPRVAALARSAGLRIGLVPSPIDDEPAASGVWRFVPTYIALRVSRDAIYEHVALAYYRRQGWITATLP